MSTIRLLRLATGTPILTQLRLEEALLRHTSDNWCVMAEASGPPSIVLGISGKPAKMCNLDLVARDRVPLIRRFTGGGTVVVGDGTLFVRWGGVLIVV